MLTLLFLSHWAEHMDSDYANFMEMLISMFPLCLSFVTVYKCYFCFIIGLSDWERKELW